MSSKVEPSVSRVLWRRPVPLIAWGWLALPVGVVLSTCLVGLPLVRLALGRLTLTLVQNARGLLGEAAPDDDRGVAGGALGVVMLALFGGAMGGAQAIAEHLLGGAAPLVRLVGGLTAGALAAQLLALALAPLLFAPIHAALGVTGLLTVFERSFRLAAVRGPRATALTGAQIGLVFAVSFVGLGLASYAMSLNVDPLESVLVIAAPLGACLGTPRALAVLARDEALNPEPHGRRSPAEGGRLDAAARLRGLTLMIAPPLLATGAIFVVCAVSPMPLRLSADAPPVPRGLDGWGRPLSRSGTLPGTSVALSIEAHGILIEAADGGGAGAVDAGFDTSTAALFVDQHTRNGVPVPRYRVMVTDGERYASTVVDRDGVRLDDSITDRTLGRLSGVGSVALTLALLLLLYLTFSVGTEMGAAQALSAPDLLGGKRRGGGLAGLTGTLRVGHDSRAVFRPRRKLARFFGDCAGDLVVEGEAWVEADGGALRFRLPDRPVPILGAGAEVSWDGSGVVLVSTFPSSGAAGLRTAAAAWPPDARLSLGRPDDASAALVDRAVGRAARVALPMVSGLLVTVATLVFQLWH